jgi:hypothetical protein
VRPWPLNGSNSVPIGPIVDHGRGLYLGPHERGLIPITVDSCDERTSLSDSHV